MNVKRCVDELEAKGLIASGIRGGSRTSRKLSLSERGAELVVKVDTLARAQQKWIEEGLGEELFSDLVRSLDSLGTLLPKVFETI
jgi:DNA-binding MarR family transcriptional regulator